MTIKITINCNSIAKSITVNWMKLIKYTIMKNVKSMVYSPRCDWNSKSSHYRTSFTRVVASKFSVPCGFWRKTLRIWLICTKMAKLIWLRPNLDKIVAGCWAPYISGGLYRPPPPTVATSLSFTSIINNYEF